MKTKKTEKNKKRAFTLAETMIVLIVLGVIASITVPTLIRRQIDSANRTKIRKAVQVYETAFSKMAIENDIKGNANLSTFAPNNNCTNTAPYFKAVENIDNNICKFRTSDGVWWDISDITHPIIALDRDNLLAANAADPNNNKAYYLVGRFDDNTGILRVNDKAFEDSIANGNDNNKAYLAKLYGFLNKQSSSGNTVACAYNDYVCNINNMPECEKDEDTDEYLTSSTNCYEVYDQGYSLDYYYYDDSGNLINITVDKATNQKEFEMIIRPDDSYEAYSWSWDEGTLTREEDLRWLASDLFGNDIYSKDFDYTSAEHYDNSNGDARSKWYKGDKLVREYSNDENGEVDIYYDYDAYGPGSDVMYKMEILPDGTVIGSTTSMTNNQLWTTYTIYPDGRKVYEDVGATTININSDGSATVRMNDPDSNFYMIRYYNNYYNKWESPSYKCFNLNDVEISCD